MLVLSRRVGESVVIGDDITVTVLEVRGDVVRIGIDAPRSVAVNRAELLAEVTNNNQAAEQKSADALVTLRTALSEVENTDLPKAMVDLQMHEVAYQAALAATARVMQPSLVDFLR